MSEMEAKRNRVSALLDAQMSFYEIPNLVPCSKGLIAKVKKLKEVKKCRGSASPINASKHPALAMMPPYWFLKGLRIGLK